MTANTFFGMLLCSAVMELPYRCIGRIYAKLKGMSAPGAKWSKEAPHPRGRDCHVPRDKYENVTVGREPQKMVIQTGKSRRLIGEGPANASTTSAGEDVVCETLLLWQSNPHSSRKKQGTTHFSQGMGAERQGDTAAAAMVFSDKVATRSCVLPRPTDTRVPYTQTRAFRTHRMYQHLVQC